MKRFLAILVLGLLWCNVNAVAEEKKVYFCTDNPEYISSAWLPFISKEPCEYTEITAAEYVEEIINAYGKKTEVIQSLYNDFQSHNLDTNIVKKIAEQKTPDTEISVAKKSEEKNLDFESSLPECEGSPFMVQAATEGDLIKILTGKLFKKWTNCHGVIDAEELGEFSGEFKDGKLKKEGFYIASDGGKYIGEFKDDNPLKKFHGQGAYTYPNGEKYVGGYKKGKKHGQGTYTFPNGIKYVGEFKNGKYHGQGTITHPEGLKYVGEFKDNYYKQGTLSAPGLGKYTGQFKDNLPHGQGTMTHADGKIEKGIWKDGEFVK